jgi:hypothetical protein
MTVKRTHSVEWNGLPLIVEGWYEPEEPDTRETPGSPQNFNTVKIWLEGVALELAGHLSHSVVESIEERVIEMHYE